jgi:hypothetical protein
LGWNLCCQQGYGKGVIFNRPTNLWLAAATALFNVVVLVLGANGVVVTAELVSAVNIALASVILLIAFQPPQVSTSDSVVVKTSNGHPDKRITFNEAGFAVTTSIPDKENKT